MSIKIVNSTQSAYRYPLLIKQLLLTPLASAPDQEISYQDKLRYTYRTLNERIARLANALQAQGVEAGNTVAIMDWDSHRYLESFFAVPMMGAVLQTVNVRLSPEQILYTLNHAGADILLVNNEFFPILAEIAPKLETVKAFILIADADSDAPPPVAFAGEYEALLANAAAEFDFPDFDENAQATTFYTTGTTGNPKGVYFSHRQLVLHTLGCASALGWANGQGHIHREDVYMPLTPMFHVHAWGFPYLATMMGLRQVYPGRYQPDVICKLVQTERVSFSHCVPTILHMVLSHPLAKEIDFSGWKILIGGSAMPEAMASQAQKRGIDLFTGYGMSETCPILTIAHVRDELPDADAKAAERIRTGYSIPLVDLRTVDEEMLDVPHDGKASGEIVVRAPWLTQGYLHNPTASEDLWAGAYLHTGDIGGLDPRGMLTVTDRLKDVIKTGGEWVSSLELESIISQHPAVNEVAVVGVKDDKWGERPLAMIVLREGQTAEADDIRAHVQKFAEEGHISKFAIPDQVRFVASLARTSVGKLNKKAMREQLAG